MTFDLVIVQPFHICHINWASRIPHFKKLEFRDQKALIRNGYTELFILTLALQPRNQCDGMNYEAERERLEHYVTADVMDKIQEMQPDLTEMGALKAIILLNPDSRGLVYPEQVHAIREKLYAALEAYCKVLHSFYQYYTSAYTD